MRTLLPRATRLVDYYLSSACYDGHSGFDPKGYGVVIDWGYSKSPSYPVDMCLNALLVTALKALVAWTSALGADAASKKYAAALGVQNNVIEQYLKLEQAEWVVVDEGEFDGSARVERGGDAGADAAERESVGFDPSTLGMHAAALLLRAGSFDKAPTCKQQCIDFIKAKLGTMFPLNPAVQ